jgi:hypothetical protein
LEDGGLGKELALLGASTSRSRLFDGLGLDGEGEREEAALFLAAERLACGVGIALAEEGGLGQLPGGLLESRLLLGDGGEKTPTLAFVEGGGVVDDQSVGEFPDDGGLLGGSVGVAASFCSRRAPRSSQTFSSQAFSRTSPFAAKVPGRREMKRMFSRLIQARFFSLTRAESAM